MENETLTARDYQDAITVQDACNLSGVVLSWAKVITKIPFSGGTAGRNTHPINVMFASKVASLTGCESMDNFHNAYKACQEKAAEVANG